VRQRLTGYSLSVVIALCASLLLLSFQSQAQQQSEDGQTTTALTIILAGPHRSEAERARDQYRHPLETLSWFGIQDNMTVVEIWPGRGWYTAILAPFLKEGGRYYAATFENVQPLKDKLAASPNLYSKVILTELIPPSKTDIAPEGTADIVLTFRNVHNWMSRGYAEEVFKAMYRALKPGGILGVVEHRGNPAVPQDPKAASGYVNEDYVIKLAEDAGFRLAGRSEINANPKDAKDYPQGVWTLPPTLRLKDVDREKYLAIGESDRLTLKFTKPAS